jgi:hypothetical protein
MSCVDYEIGAERKRRINVLRIPFPGMERNLFAGLSRPGHNLLDIRDITGTADPKATGNIFTTLTAEYHRPEWEALPGFLQCSYTIGTSFAEICTPRSSAGDHTRDTSPHSGNELLPGCRSKKAVLQAIRGSYKGRKIAIGSAIHCDCVAQVRMGIEEGRADPVRRRKGVVFDCRDHAALYDDIDG